MQQKKNKMDKAVCENFYIIILYIKISICHMSLLHRFAGTGGSQWQDRAAAPDAHSWEGWHGKTPSGEGGNQCLVWGSCPCGRSGARGERNLRTTARAGERGGSAAVGRPALLQLGF